MKLTPRITLIFVLYAVALLVGVAWLAYHSGRESLRSATVSELRSTAIEKQAALNAWVEEKRRDIAILAASPAIIENAITLNATAPGSLEARVAHDRFVLEARPHVFEGEFLVIMLLDPDTGQVIAATNPSEEGKFKEDRPFFLNGKIEPYVQNVYYSISEHGPAMTSAAPLWSTDGKLLGVLAGRLDLEDMNSIINRQVGIWQTEEAFLVNTAHLFVTQPRLSIDPAVLQRGVHTEAVNRCLTQSNGELSDLDYRGNPALIVYRWLPGNDLCLIVKIDQDEALAPAFTFGRRVAVISGLALLGACLLAVLFSRSITRPIQVLQSEMTRFGEGEQDIRLPETGKDELGDLAREFNRMAASIVEKDARLHEYATELERKVEERTAEIKQREERYRSLFENMLNGFAYCQMLFEGERPQDFTYLSVNKAFEGLTGLKNVVGKKVSEVIPGILETDPGLIETYGRVASTGVPEVFETYLDALKMWFSISVYSPQKGYFVAVFDVITERKQTEETLRRYELLSEHSRDMILFMRRDDGHILEANAAATQAYGYSHDELLMLAVRDLRAPNTKKLTADQMAQADSEGILFETLHQRKDGSVFPVEVSSQGTTIGGVRTLVSIVRDITERKRAEEAIESLSKFPTENPNPVLRVLNDGQLIYANAASEELLEMWSCEIEDHLPPGMTDLIAETMNNASIKIEDIPCQDKVYSLMLVPLVESGYVNIYGRDVTERKQAEEALQASEARYRHTLDDMLEGCQIIGFDWHYLYLNDVADKHNRRPKEELLGKKYMDMWPGIEDTHVFSVIRRCMEERESQFMENEFTFPDGSQGWFELRIYPVPEGIVILSIDITERKHAADELHRTLDDLKRSNAELEQFAYVSSHDLQEPLRGIAGMAQLLQRRYQGQLDNRADEYINHIVDGSLRMQTLINDLLAYSRVGRRGEPIQTTDAEAALQATLQNLNLAIQEYGARITNDSLPTVQADPTQLIQIFQNLIGNAIKFRAEERPPQIHVGAADAGGFWQFSICDNGIGIEPEYFERIFQVFQRLHTRREYTGTGIGLAICKKIIERHGGNIWVESEPGQGSTFYFTLRKGN